METYDLIVIGAGSGNMLFTPELAQLRAAIVEPDRFGGTCLNRGCIPSKMLVVAADAARAVDDASRLGVHARLERVDWPAIRDRVFGRIDPLHERAAAYRRKSGVDVYTEPARFIAPRRIQVGDRVISGEQIVSLPRATERTSAAAAGSSQMFTSVRSTPARSSSRRRTWQKPHPGRQ